MVHFYPTLQNLFKATIICVLSIVMSVGSFAQSNDDACGCLRSFFDYLLAADRLNIPKNDMVTVEQVVSDARRAGHIFKIEHCEIFKRNRSGYFYTLTPEYVRVPGMIIAPQDSAYRAVIGNCVVSFTPATGGFEHNLSAFLSKGCSGTGSVEYTLDAIPSVCSTYTIQHAPSHDSLSWYVNYKDCNGQIAIRWFSPAETLVQLDGVSVMSVGDADTLRRVYATASYSISSTVSAVPINNATYLRPVVATLSVECQQEQPLQDTEIVAYPNPSSGIFYLNFRQTTTEPIRVRLLNSMGRVVEAKQFAAGTRQAAVGQQLTVGVYYAECTSGVQRKVVTLVRR